MKIQETITTLDTISTALNWYEEDRERGKESDIDLEKLKTQIEQARDFIAGIYEFESQTNWLEVKEEDAEAFAYGLFHDLKVLANLVESALDGYGIAESSHQQKMVLSQFKYHFEIYMSIRSYLNSEVPS